MPTLMGLGGWDHDSSAALVGDRHVIALGEEERFTRKKHQGQRHLASIGFCLSYLGASRLDALAYSFCDPKLVNHLSKSIRDHWPELGLIVSPVDHHLSHALTAFSLSDFEESLVLTIDGFGDGTSTAAWSVDSEAARPIWSVPYPHSIGSLWMGINYLLGFGMRDAGKVMGLAAYGRPRYSELLMNAMELLPDGRYLYKVDQYGLRAFLHSEHSLLRRVIGKPRSQGEPLGELHQDIAASIQAATEELVLHALTCLTEETGHTNLCLAGGVAMNSALNGKILKSGLFEHVFVPPNPGDSGTSIGCVLGLVGTTKAGRAMSSPYLGEGYDTKRIETAIEQWGFEFTYHEQIERVVATLLERGKIVGWFQGRAEVGPRALGNRSILADPRLASMKDILNRRVKHREEFRPFAPVVLEEKATEWFELNDSAPFMSFVVPVRDHRRSEIPAVTHVDGTARPQTVNSSQNERLARLLREFESLTGVPILLNTSFNVMGEPIVNSPEDAIRCFAGTGLDYLVLKEFLVRKPSAV